VFEVRALQLVVKVEKGVTLHDHHKHMQHQDLNTAELNLRILNGEAHARTKDSIDTRIDTITHNEVIGEELENTVIEVGAAEKCISASSKHIGTTILDTQQNGVEDTTAKIINKNGK